MNSRYFLCALVLAMALEANANSSTVDAAIGGALGGAAGAAIGNEIGGRDGAIVGGALGAARGTTVTTDRNRRHAEPFPRYRRHDYGYPAGGMRPGYHCPPGLAKQGRC